MTNLDHMQSRQVKLSVLFALSFAVWQTSTLLVDHAQASGMLQHVFIGIMIASALFWLVIMIILFGGLFHGKNKTMQTLAKDEWQKYVSANAISASYVALTPSSGWVSCGHLWWGLSIVKSRSVFTYHRRDCASSSFRNSRQIMGAPRDD